MSLKGSIGRGGHLDKQTEYFVHSSVKLFMYFYFIARSFIVFKTV